MKFAGFVLLTLILLSCSQGTDEPLSETEVPEDQPEQEDLILEVSAESINDLTSFIPEGYSILDTAMGDLNFDELTDCILVLRRDGEDTLSDVIEHPEKRPLLILLRNDRLELELTRRNDNTVYCVDCGGMMGDPYMGITIKDGYFSVEHYGGSAWRWTRIITYRYSKEEKDWFLHKDGSESFHAAEPDDVESDIKTVKDFGRVKFTDFDLYAE